MCAESSYGTMSYVTNLSYSKAVGVLARPRLTTWIGVLCLCVSAAGCGMGGNQARGMGAPQRALSALATRLAAAPAVPSDQAIGYRDIEHRVIIYNPGSKYSFALFGTVVYTVHVQRSSAATISERVLGRPAFTSSASRALWRAAGSPELPGGTGSGFLSLGRDRFGFNPQGRTLTYSDVEHMPTTAAGVMHSIRRILRPFDSAPPATLLIKQFGYLLANAPLSPGTRAAILRATAALPGVRLCGIARDSVGRVGQQVCAYDPQVVMAVLIDPRSGAVLSVVEYLRRRSTLYPGMSPGTVITSDTFVRLPQ
jgi:hypothetical protein